jgi:hypothetical protein
MISFFDFAISRHFIIDTPFSRCYAQLAAFDYYAAHASPFSPFRAAIAAAPPIIFTPPITDR